MRFVILPLPLILSGIGVGQSALTAPLTVLPLTLISCTFWIGHRAQSVFAVPPATTSSCTARSRRKTDHYEKEGQLILLHRIPLSPDIWRCLQFHGKATLFNIENLILTARSKFNGFAGTAASIYGGFRFQCSGFSFFVFLS
jgi:hypothetical protein